MSSSHDQNSNLVNGGQKNDAPRAVEQNTNLYRCRYTALTDKAQLDLSEQKFCSVMALVSDGVVSFDEFGVIETFNKAAEKIFGYDAEDVIGCSFGRLIPPSQSSNQQEDELKKGPIGVRKDRKKIRLKLDLSKLQIGQHTTFVAIIRPAGEIELLRSELEEEKARARRAFEHSSELLGTANSRLHNRIQEIMSETERLMDQQTDEGANEPLLGIRHNGAYLLSFFEHLLDYVELAAGRKTSKKVKSSSFEILDRIWKRFEQKSVDHGVAFAIECRGAIPERIRTDAEFVSQILIELTGNAIKFAKNGQVRLTVSFSEGRENENHRLVYEVFDTGPGVPENLVPTLFDPFAGDDDSDRNADPCAGLGLAIAQCRAVSLGTRITYRPAGERGSIFTLEIETGSIKNSSMMNRDLQSIESESSSKNSEQLQAVVATT